MYFSYHNFHYSIPKNNVVLSIVKKKIIIKRKKKNIIYKILSKQDFAL